MTRRRRLQRRLLWAGVVLGLVLLVASVWLLSAVLWAHDRVRAAGSRNRFAPTTRKGSTMHSRMSLVVLATAGAMLLAAPAFADSWGADRHAQTSAAIVTSDPDWFERFAAAHSMREPVRDDRFHIDPAVSTPVAAANTDDEIPQIGIGLILGLVLFLGLFLATRMLQIRRPAAR